MPLCTVATELYYESSLAKRLLYQAGTNYQILSEYIFEVGLSAHTVGVGQTGTRL